MSKFLISTVVLFFSVFFFESADASFNPFCDSKPEACDSKREVQFNNCTLAGGIGTRAPLPFMIYDFGLSNGRTSYCQVQKCNPGFHRSGAICLRDIATQECRVNKGSGSQNTYAGKWSSCLAKQCESGYSLSRGICRSDSLPDVSPAKACTIFGGRGFVRSLTESRSYCQRISCNKGYKISGNTCVVGDAPTAKVNLVILRRNDGSGNEKWDIIYINRMIDQLTELTQGHVKFYLGRVQYIRDSADYGNSKQDNIKMNYIQFREFGAITGIVSQHDTTDSRGTAIGIKENYEPIFVFRSWYNSGSDADSKMAAAVFLHELGHNMGMKHNYNSAVHMDNHYYKKPQILQSYVRGLNGCKVPSLSCAASKTKFGNYLSITQDDR